MIRIKFNSRTLQIEEGLTLELFLKSQNFPINGVAAIINQSIIPRSQYMHILIQQDDVIEMLMPMQGG